MTDAAPLVLDPADELQARALARLATERIAWFTSTSRTGFPHAVPVWYLWHDGAVIVLSEPGAVKMRNAKRDPKVLVHLESGADEEQLTVLQGTVEVFDGASPDWMPRIGDAYFVKYDDDLPPLELTRASMAERYSTVLRITPVKLIAW